MAVSCWPRPVRREGWGESRGWCSTLAPGTPATGSPRVVTSSEEMAATTRAVDWDSAATSSTDRSARDTFSTESSSIL